MKTILAFILSMAMIGLAHGKEDYSQYTNVERTSLIWLSRAIYFESAGESVWGKIAVGQVIIKRKTDDKYPDTIKEVILSPRQFSFTITRASMVPSPRNNEESQALKNSTFIAASLLNGSIKTDLTGGAELYYACDGPNKIDPPDWNWSLLEATVKIDNHCFFKYK